MKLNILQTAFGLKRQAHQNSKTMIKTEPINQGEKKVVCPSQEIQHPIVRKIEYSLEVGKPSGRTHVHFRPFDLNETGALLQNIKSALQKIGYRMPGRTRDFKHSNGCFKINKTKKPVADIFFTKDPKNYITSHPSSLHVDDEHEAVITAILSAIQTSKKGIR